MSFKYCIKKIPKNISFIQNLQSVSASPWENVDCEPLLLDISCHRKISSKAPCAHTRTHAPHMQNTLAYTASTCGFMNKCMSRKSTDKCKFAEWQCEWGGYLKATIAFSSTVFNWCSGLLPYKRPYRVWNRYTSFPEAIQSKSYLYIFEYFEVLQHEAYCKTASYCSTTMKEHIFYKSIIQFTHLQMS